jgi:hypothetical protein
MFEVIDNEGCIPVIIEFGKIALVTEWNKGIRLLFL